MDGKDPLFGRFSTKTGTLENLKEHASFSKHVNWIEIHE
jgi:hypothetical protein